MEVNWVEIVLEGIERHLRILGDVFYEGGV